MTVDGAIMGDSFGAWYADTINTWAVGGGGGGQIGNSSKHRHYETCDIKPCGADKCH